MVLAGLTKSAQVPFSAWLPAAIAAPTPVSALVHSSTLVTAGVYLIIRVSRVIYISELLIFLSLLTMILAGLGACFEKDMKRIIALSTLSQLGVIMFILSLGMSELSYFHLLTHALFKSLLFLCAGLYIHGGVDQQDTRGIGNQLFGLPVVGCYFLTANLSLAGFPFMSGFYSKDLIFEVFEIQGVGLFLYVIVCISMLRTVVYRVRLLFYQVVGEIGPRGGLIFRDEVKLAIYPMFVLFLMATTGGSFLSWVIQPILLIMFSGLVKIRLTFIVFLLGLLGLTY